MARCSRYLKFGVIISKLLQEAVRQPTLWNELDRELWERAWKTVDRLNAMLGRGYGNERGRDGRS